jgi:epsilon-lactone hydrolase
MFAERQTPPMPSEAMQAIIDTLRAAPPAADRDIAVRRKEMNELAAISPIDERVSVEPVDAAGVPCERIAAPGTTDDAWLLYLHGGAYVAGSLLTHRSHAARLSAAIGCTVLNVDYRLAPEHPYPAAVDDAVAAYRWLLGPGGAAPERVAIAGDSAGGGLSAALLVALRDAGDPLPACAALISPWTDLTMTAATYETRADADPMIARDRLAVDAASYLAGADPRTPLASPLHADLRDLPPVLVHVGDAECLLDDSVVFAERAAAAGVDCTLEVTPEAIHVWHVFAGFAPEADAAVARLASWVRDRLGL